jgi:ribonucrease Y
LNEEQRQVDKDIEQAGDQAALTPMFPACCIPKSCKVLGRLKYRTSYGQNQLSHAVEVSKLASVIAAELGADIEVCKLGASARPGQSHGPQHRGHARQIGAEFARRHGVNAKVVNCIASHHHEVEQESGRSRDRRSRRCYLRRAPRRPPRRPGAVHQAPARLEDIANSFKGVSQSYAIQAGREVRIIVRPEDVDDLGSTRLARDIAKKVEETMQYPGQIKVTVIRETRAVDYAK